MSTEHTPGPWETWTSMLGVISVKSKDGFIADCPYGAGSSEANARLIAAAPDTKRERDELLAALEEIQEFAKDNPGCGFSCGKIAQAAIAKAKGGQG